jgi:hypothetical protein
MLLLPQKHKYYNADVLKTTDPNETKNMVNTFLARFTLCDYLAVVVIDDVFIGEEINFKLFSN